MNEIDELLACIAADQQKIDDATIHQAECKVKLKAMQDKIVKALKPGPVYRGTAG